MEKKKNILIRFITNIYVRNIFLMVAVFVILVIIVLFALNSYTKHNESITVPSLKGLQVEEASNILRSADLKYEIIDSLYLSEGTPGAIVEQIPKESSKVKKGRTVFLYIQAKSVQMIPMPDLKDTSRRQAETQLNSLGFTNITIVEEPSIYKGLVISISYRGKAIIPGQKIPKGSPLTMTIGAGGESDEDSIPESPETPNIENSFFD